jgi:hypothetical protein
MRCARACRYGTARSPPFCLRIDELQRTPPLAVGPSSSPDKQGLPAARAGGLASSALTSATA